MGFNISFKIIQSERGFTLIELLVVVLIIGILAAIALPQYRLSVLKTKASQALPVLRAIGLAEDDYFLANSAYTTDYANLAVSMCGGSGSSCAVNDAQYDLQGDGNIVAFLNPASSGGSGNALSIMYRYAKQDSAVYTNLKQGDFVCIPRNKADFIKACKSLAGNNYKTVIGFTNGEGYGWR